MGKDVHRIALDSMSLTYAVGAFHAVEGPPTAPCEDEKLALYRIYLYLPTTFNICPTVEMEFQRIGDDGKRALHQSWCDTLFMTFVPAPDTNLVRQRALEL